MLYYHCVQVNPVIEFGSSFGRSYSTEPVNELTQSPYPHFSDEKKGAFFFSAGSSLTWREGWFYFLFYFDRLSNIPELAVCARLVPVLRTARLRISSGDDVARSDRIEAEVFYVGRLVTSLAVLGLFVPRPFSSARPKGQHNVGVQVPKQLQLSSE